MSPKFPRRRPSGRLRPHASHSVPDPDHAAADADDGIDPRILLRSFRADERRPRGADPGTRRLCSQIRDALTFALAECGDEVLQSLWVSSVAAAPDASRLAVTVVPADVAEIPAADEALARAAVHLRAAVAASICRKRAPELVFRVRADGEDAR